jgi:hypothetical protein
VLLVVVVVVGGFWVRNQLQNAQEERCALAFGQIRLLQAEMNALQFRAIPSEGQALANAGIEKAVARVEASCGPIPALT